MNMVKLPLVLPEPNRPTHLPINAKWLSGEGAGSWFVIKEEKNSQLYIITRYSPDGNMECKGIFKTDNKVDLGKNFSITYPSHCLKVTILQGNDKYLFVSINS